MSFFHIYIIFNLLWVADAENWYKIFSLLAVSDVSLFKTATWVDLFEYFFSDEIKKFTNRLFGNVFMHKINVNLENFPFIVQQTTSHFASCQYSNCTHIKEFTEQAPGSNFTFWIFNDSRRRCEGIKNFILFRTKLNSLANFHTFAIFNKSSKQNPEKRRKVMLWGKKFEF